MFERLSSGFYLPTAGSLIIYSKLPIGVSERVIVCVHGAPRWTFSCFAPQTTIKYCWWMNEWINAWMITCNVLRDHWTITRLTVKLWPAFESNRDGASYVYSVAIWQPRNRHSGSASFSPSRNCTPDPTHTYTHTHTISVHFSGSAGGNFSYFLVFSARTAGMHDQEKTKSARRDVLHICRCTLYLLLLCLEPKIALTGEKLLF